jgi:hypothetical protein
MMVVAAVALSLFVPLLMAQQEWDDHDRSKNNSHVMLPKTI